MHQHGKQHPAAEVGGVGDTSNKRCKMFNAQALDWDQFYGTKSCCKEEASALGAGPGEAATQASGPCAIEGFLVLETPPTSRSSSIAVPATPDQLSPPAAAAGPIGEILDTQAPLEVAAREATACDVLSYLSSKGGTHCLTGEFMTHLHTTMGWEPSAYYLKLRASPTSPGKVLESGDMLTVGDEVTVHWRLRGGGSEPGDKLWHVDSMLLWDCKLRVQKLLEVAHTNRHRRGFGVNEVDTEAGVDRCHDLFIFGEHVRTEFQDFLKGSWSSQGGTALSRANVLSVAEDEVLFALAADAANFFRLGDALPVLAQVVDEGVGYKLPSHCDKGVWDTAVSVTLEGSAEWQIGSDVLQVGPGTAWAISHHGEHVYPYNTPHGHSKTNARRLAVVLRYKFREGHVPVSPDAAAGEATDSEGDGGSYAGDAEDDFHNDMFAANDSNNSTVEELVLQPSMEADGVEIVECAAGPDNESTSLPATQRPKVQLPGAAIGMDTANAEDEPGDTYTLDELRDEAKKYVDDNNNGDSFDDLWHGMDEWSEELHPGATAARSRLLLLPFD
jgi:hypothetical protein